MKRVSKAFRKVKGTTRVSQLLILISFLVTFIFARFTVALQQFGLRSIIYNGLHIHHLVVGIFLILLSGYIGISFWRTQKLRWLMAILFGTGAALTIDEFALWLHLRDVYWQSEGIISVDAIIIISVLLLIGFLLSERHDHYLFKSFWRNIFRDRKT